jgi:hypothetical protein
LEFNTFVFIPFLLDCNDGDLTLSCKQLIDQFCFIILSYKGLIAKKIICEPFIHLSYSWWIPIRYKV